MKESVPIGPGTRVTLTFALSMESGDLIDGTGETPASFTVGDGNLLPGFESAIFGMKQGSVSTRRSDHASPPSII